LTSFGTLDPFRRQLERPGQDERDRKPEEHDRDKDFQYPNRHPAKGEGVGLGEVFRRVKIQLLWHAVASFEDGFVRNHFTMIAAPVQCDVNGIRKRSHHARLHPRASTSQSRKRAITCVLRSSSTRRSFCEGRCDRYEKITAAVSDKPARWRGGRQLVGECKPGDNAQRADDVRAKT
jgi:hypothetical protein